MPGKEAVWGMANKNDLKATSSAALFGIGDRGVMDAHYSGKWHVG